LQTMVQYSFLYPGFRLAVVFETHTFGV